MKKWVIIIGVIITSLLLFSLVSAGSPPVRADYHSKCNSKDCLRVSGAGDYVCNPGDGNSDGDWSRSDNNRCCVHKVCESQTDGSFKCVSKPTKGDKACYDDPANYFASINPNECEKDTDCSPCTKEEENPCVTNKDCKFSVGTCTLSTTNIGLPHCEYQNLPAGSPCSNNRVCDSNGKCTLNTCIVGSDITSICRCDKEKETTPLYWAYQAGNKSNFYTADINELDDFMRYNNYEYKGVAGYIFPLDSAQINGTTILYRTYCKGCGEKYFYTTSEEEKTHFIDDLDYTDEAEIGYIYNISTERTVALSLGSVSINNAYIYPQSPNILSSGYCCPDGASSDKCKCILNAQITSSCICNGTLVDEGACCDEGYEEDGTCKQISVTGTGWANMRDGAITAANLNDRVKLITTGIKLANKNIVYNVTRVGMESFEINPEVVKDITLGTFRIINPGRYSFDVYVNGQIYGSSEELTTIDESNQAPTAVILTSTESKFQVGDVNFTQASYDSDDDINVVWDFGDGKSEKINKCQTTGNCNVTHRYDSSGTMIVKLNVTDERNIQKSHSVRIYVYENGVNIFPKITTPGINEVVSGSIRFNAAESYVSNCAETCLAPVGNCYSVGSLQCYDLTKSTPLSGYNLWFNWTFDDGSSKYGSWNGDYNSAVEFDKIFIQVGNHWAKLKLGYEVL